MPVLFAGVLICASSPGHAANECISNNRGADPGPSPTCAVAPQPTWPPFEKWAWNHICEGETADFKKWAKDKDHRLDIRITPDFLRTILLQEPFRSAIPHQGVRISHACFDSTVDLRDASIDSPLKLSSSRFHAPVFLMRVTTPNYISFDDSTFSRKLNMSFASIAGSLSVENAIFEGPVDLWGARIGRTLTMKGSVFHDPVTMRYASIGDNLFLPNTHFKAAADLTIDNVDGWLSVTNSTFDDRVTMDAASIAGSLFMRRARFARPVTLRFVEVGSNLDARGATLAGLDLTSARIERELRLGPLDDKDIEWNRYNDESGNPQEPALTLHNAGAGVLQDTRTSWPENLKLDGFTYDRFGAADAEAPYERASKWFLDWLEKSEPYSPQPYEQLASVLRAHALHSKADDVLLNNRKRQRGAFEWSVEWFSSYFLQRLYGYGYGRHSFWALIATTAFFAILGTIIVSRERRGHPAISGLFDSACYSLDMFLPLIRLRERHYTDVDLITWVRFYFYFHKIAGYLLMFFVLAWLTGLAS